MTRHIRTRTHHSRKRSLQSSSSWRHVPLSNHSQKQLRRHKFPRMVTAQGSLPQVNKALLLRAGLYSASHMGANWANFFFFYAAKGEAKPPSLYIKLPTETFGAWPEAEEARATFQLLATLLKCTEAAPKLPNGAPSPTNKEEGQTPPRCTTERQPRSSLGGHFQELPRVPGRKFGLSLLRHPLSACTHSSRCPLEGQQ